MAFDWRRAAGLVVDVGGGQIPTERHFARLKRPLWIALHGVHDNPRFYKHYWRIWGRLDVLPDEKLAEFRRRFGPYPWLAVAPELSFSEAIARMQSHCARGECFMVVDERVKRADPAAPWDIPLIRSKGGRVAPAYDDDTDEPFHSYK